MEPAELAVHLVSKAVVRAEDLMPRSPKGKIRVAALGWSQECG